MPANPYVCAHMYTYIDMLRKQYIIGLKLL